jgi:hypothetical protein
MTTFINVPTWHGQQRPLEVLLFRLYVHFIGRECQWFFREFRPPLCYIGQLWHQERLLLGLVSFQIFAHLHAQALLMMGLGPRFCVFSSLSFPLCILHFGVWSFVWTSVFSFSSPVPFLGVFPLFIYLLGEFYASMWEIPIKADLTTWVLSSSYSIQLLVSSFAGCFV